MKADRKSRCPRCHGKGCRTVIAGPHIRDHGEPFPGGPVQIDCGKCGGTGRVALTPFRRRVLRLARELPGGVRPQSVVIAERLGHGTDTRVSEALDWLEHHGFLLEEKNAAD